jgi:hypothetical protein
MFGVSLPSTGSPLLTDCKMCTRPSTMNNATRPRECGRVHAGNITIKRSHSERSVCVTELCARHSVRAIFYLHPLKILAAEHQNRTHSLSLSSPRTDGAFLYASLFVICYSLFFRRSLLFREISCKRSRRNSVLVGRK